MGFALGPEGTGLGAMLQQRRLRLETTCSPEIAEHLICPQEGLLSDSIALRGGEELGAARLL